MRIAVLGSGNGGFATAFDCALHGHEVSLHGLSEFGIEEQIAGMEKRGGLVGTGVLEGTVDLAYIGPDLSKVLKDVDLVYIVGPAMATDPVAKSAKEYLRPETPVVVMPGSCFGAVVAKRALGAGLGDATPVVAETSTLPYAARVLEPGHVHIYHKLPDGLFLSTVPGGMESASAVIEKIRDVYPGIAPAASVVQTTLQNGNPVIHPAVTLLNACLIDRTGGDFLFYEEGVTPASGRLMEAVDRERMAIAKALGVTIISEPETGLKQGYQLEANYTTGYSTAPGFLGIKAQSSLENRYLTEDVGFTMLFFLELAKVAGVQTPVMNAIVEVASAVMGRDFRKLPRRSLSDLGLADATAEQLRAL